MQQERLRDDSHKDAVYSGDSQPFMRVGAPGNEIVGKTLI